MFVIHANLDAEARWAGRSLPAVVATRVSYYAALTAALAPDGAAVEVWAPAAVDASRILLPVTMRVGTPPRADLVWAQDGAKAANDRRLATALAAEYGIGVPGARMITSVDEIDLAGPWVAKAPWTAAGRDRCHGAGAPDSEKRKRIQKLLRWQGALVLEPWLERALDVGVRAMVHSDRSAIVEPPHSVLTSPRGDFLGIDLTPPALNFEQQRQLLEFVRVVGSRIDYVGPITVDAFVTANGRLCVCEINARHSFGWVASALALRDGTTKLGMSLAPANARMLIARHPDPSYDDGITAWIA